MSRAIRPDELRCPECRGSLDTGAQSGGGELICRSCGGAYPVVAGIPDLRVFDDPYIDAASDREKGRRLYDEVGAATFRELVEHYYARTPEVPPEHADQYTRGLLAAEARSASANRLRCEHAPPEVERPRVLSVGCGTAPALAADGVRFTDPVGVDIAFRWLVVGRKRLQERGVSAALYCCCAESLPIPDAAFDLVISDYVLAHVRRPDRALSEIHRVLRPGGAVWVAAANRWSLGPDPQTGLLAGGLLPDAVVDWWVRRRGGIPPERRLLSARSLRRLLRDGGFRDFEVLLPEIPAGQRDAFGAAVRFAARGYEVLRRWPPGASLLRVIGPSFLAVGRKPVSGSGPYMADPRDPRG